MNIVYLIGNGFDLNLGLQTKYQHFYDYYLTHSEGNDSPHIKDLKDHIKNNRENWSDLEFALGDYLRMINTDDAVTLHDHLVDHLSKHCPVPK